MKNIKQLSFLEIKEDQNNVNKQLTGEKTAWHPTDARPVGWEQKTSSPVDEAQPPPNEKGE